MVIFAEAIERDRIGVRRWLLIFLVVAAVILDGLDIQLLSVLSPVIISDLNTTRAYFGPAMSAAMFGMSIGAVIGGWIGDRYGPKRALVAMLTMFGVATIATGWITSLSEIVLLRAIGGIGFGAATPNAMVLASDWMPKRWRPHLNALISVGTPLGGMLGAWAVLHVLPSLGWRGSFISAGLLTIMLAALAAVLLPEAFTFLLRVGKHRKAAVLAKRVLAVDVTTANPDIAPDSEERDRATGIQALLGPGYARFSIAIWLTYFGVAFVSYAVAAWTAVLMTGLGFPLAQAVQTALAFNLFAVVAALVTGPLLARFGSRMVALSASWGTLAFVVLLTVAVQMRHDTAIEATDPRIFMIAIGGIGATAGCFTATIYSLLAFAYPASRKATGIGFGLMMGRIGGIVATFSGGTLLEDLQHRPLLFPFVLIVLATISIVAVLPININIPPAAQKS